MDDVVEFIALGALLPVPKPHVGSIKDDLGLELQLWHVSQFVRYILEHFMLLLVGFRDIFFNRDFLVDNVLAEGENVVPFTGMSKPYEKGGMFSIFTFSKRVSMFNARPEQVFIRNFHLIL